MKKTFLILFLVISSFAFSITAKENDPSERTIKDFHLLNVDGKTISLSGYENAKGFIIVFTCNHCPFAKLYPQRMNELNKKYSELGIPLIAISSADTLMMEDDTFSEMVKKAKEENFNFPYLLDGDQSAAKDFNAQRTPHAFVIWKENEKWVVKYNGAIDDNAAKPELVSVNYIADAVDNLLQGKEVMNRETKSIGCKILFR